MFSKQQMRMVQHEKNRFWTFDSRQLRHMGNESFLPILLLVLSMMSESTLTPSSSCVTLLCNKDCVQLKSPFTLYIFRVDLHLPLTCLFYIRSVFKILTLVAEINVYLLWKCIAENACINGKWQLGFKDILLLTNIKNIIIRDTFLALFWPPPPPVTFYFFK